MKRSTATHAQARIQQLCCLGLDSYVLMPALLKELHNLIPSYGNVFSWADKHLLFSNLYDENPAFPRIAPVYLSEFYNSREREVFPSFTESMRDERGVQTLDSALKMDRRSFYKHDYYNLILRPLGYHQFIRLVLRENDRPLGRIHLYRSDNTEFTNRDKQRLLEIAPYLSHALISSENFDTPLAESPHSGLIIAEPSGRIQHLSAHARQLMWMSATRDRLPEWQFGPRGDPMLPKVVRQLYRKLTGVFRNNELKAPPVWRHRNAWGEFVYRAYWLYEGDGELRDQIKDVDARAPTRLIAVTVHRWEPLPLKLLRHSEELPLTDRQMRVCLLLATGHSLSRIAERLDVGKDSADQRCREVYARLNVRNHTELVGMLLQL